MSHFLPRAARRRNALLATTVLTALALAPALAAPTAASAIPGSNPGIMLCPPQITKIGTPIDFPVLDGESGSGYDGTIASGSMPDGLSLVPRDVGTVPKIFGTPTKVGSFAFQMHFANNVGGMDDKTCYMDIVPTGSIVERIDGETRYEVSAGVAHRVVPTGTAPVVYVASGANYSDALSASAIAAQHKAPLLLVTADDVPNYVYNTITSFKPADVVVVGGEASISADVVEQIEQMRIMPKVTRIGGADRFEVSRNLISDATFGAKASTKLYVASGLKFPDALSASPAAAKAGTPVLLVNGEATGLNAAEKALVTARGVKDATVFGGEDTLSAGLASDLKTTAGAVSRIEGDDRFIVSANVTAANYKAPVDTVYLATGVTYPDALTGGVLAGISNSPILLTRKSCMAPEVAAQVRALQPKHIVLLGGPLSLDAALENLPTC